MFNPTTREALVHKNTSQLVVGDVVVCHGLRCLIDSEPERSQGHTDIYGPVFYVRALVLNRDASDTVPHSWTLEADGSHRWTIQGNDLATWHVEDADGAAVENTPEPDPYAALIERARSDGYARGYDAGSWVTDGNTPKHTARWLLDGIADGNPAVIDQLPTCPLSGEWADDPLPGDLLYDWDVSEDDDAADDLLRAYESGFDAGVEAIVSRSARLILGLPVHTDDDATVKS